MIKETTTTIAAATQHRGEELVDGGECEGRVEEQIGDGEQAT